jgi:hypothetical protein
MIPRWSSCLVRPSFLGQTCPHHLPRASMVGTQLPRLGALCRVAAAACPWCGIRATITICSLGRAIATLRERAMRLALAAKRPGHRPCMRESCEASSSRQESKICLYGLAPHVEQVCICVAPRLHFCPRFV